MPKKSAGGKITRKTAAEIPRASKGDLDRLRAAMHGDIDTSEIAERREFQRLHRDASGKLSPRRSVIRDAVMREMKRLDLSVYRLWQLGRVHYLPLSQSAVHEFLKGERQLELPSVEALLAAVNLHVVRSGSAKKGRLARSGKRRTKQAVS
jgi:hypothetical protein